MAPKSSSAEVICEGENCETITDKTYYVKEKKKLCHDCASKEGRIGKARKCWPTVYCVKHDREIEFYSRTHDVALCYSCAMINHFQQHCVRQDRPIADAILEIKAKQNILKEKPKLFRAFEDQIHQCRKDTDTHLQASKDGVQSEKEDYEKINKEIDEKNKELQEEIQKINEQIRQNDEEREKRLELNRTNAARRGEPIDNEQHGLQTDIKNIAEEKEKNIEEFEKTWRDNTKTAETTLQTLDTVLEDDKYVVKDGLHVKTSVSGELKKPLNEDGVKQIPHAISGNVRFVKGAGREKIDLHGGEWKLIDTIKVSDKLQLPNIVGYMDECNVIITDMATMHSYMLNLNTKHTQKVITGCNASKVISCELLNDDKMVCGNSSRVCTGDSLTRCIRVYDRQWKHIKDVTIPRNTTRNITVVDVAVDQDGKIIAAEWDQPKIYVINPADGKIMTTITCKEKIRMRGVISSGHIIARPSPTDHEVFLIDRQGAQRVIPHSHEILNACINPMTDDLYVVTSDDERKTCVIDQVMSGSGMKKRRVASFPLSTRHGSLYKMLGHLLSSRVMMTSSGNMIACDGDNILVFKNH